MRTRVAVLTVLLLVAVAALVVLRRDEPKTRADYCDPPATVEPPAQLHEDATPVEVGYQQVGSIEGAVAMADAGDGRFFVATKAGELWQLAADGSTSTMVLDLTAEVATLTEQGLLGVAVDDPAEHVYVYATFKDETAQILEFALTPNGIDVDSRRVVLSLDDPNPSHNGGRLLFDDEGMLMLGLGDRGDGDRTGAAQDLGSLFGKILRIDPHAAGDEAYTIPPDNPYIGTSGARGEIWASGFRNPWGWSVDSEAGDLWVADVGQLCFEEVSVAPDRGKGANFGWSFLEGRHEFLGPVLGPGGEPDADADVADLGERPDHLVPPIIEYGHSDEACSVIGGFVYRGTRVPALAGQYLSADLCKRQVSALAPDAGDGWVQRVLGGQPPKGVVSFAQGRDGELYLVSLAVGVVRLVPA